MSNFDHIVPYIIDKTKKQLKQTVLNETINVHNKFTILERYPIDKLLSLYDYLTDLSIDHPLVHGRDQLFAKKDESTVNGRIHSQLKVIERILNLPDNIPQSIENKELHVINSYGYKTHHCKGRLYGSINTMTLISRQCRFYLFKDIYFDIDLKNAHPTMLLSYAEENGIKASALKRYVTNREDFLQYVIDKDKITRSEAKTSVLRCLNLVTDTSLTSSLKELHRDIIPIRNHLYKSNVLDTLTPLGEYTVSRDSFKGKTLEKQKISLQAQYCATEESRCVNILYEVCVRKGLLDRNVTFKKKARNISFIPFYDGAYVQFEGLNSEFEVLQILKDTNELIAPYIFELKEIVPEWEFLDEKELKNYEKIQIFLGSLTEKKFNILLQKLEIAAFSLEKETLEYMRKQNPTDKWFEGDDSKFQDYIRESVKIHKYKIRRKLSNQINSDTFDSLKNELEKIKD